MGRHLLALMDIINLPGLRKLEEGGGSKYVRIRLFKFIIPKGFAVKECFDTSRISNMPGDRIARPESPGDPNVNFVSS